MRLAYRMHTPSNDPSEEDNNNKKGAFLLLDCKWTVTTFGIDVKGKQFVIRREVKTSENTAYNCDFDKEGNCEEPVLCPQDESVTE